MELKPCPFCGSNAKVVHKSRKSRHTTFNKNWKPRNGNFIKTTEVSKNYFRFDYVIDYYWCECDNKDCKCKIGKKFYNENDAMNFWNNRAEFLK